MVRMRETYIAIFFYALVNYNMKRNGSDSILTKCRRELKRKKSPCSTGKQPRDLVNIVALPIAEETTGS